MYAVLPGSRLSRLARRRWRHTWLVWLALAVQVVVISVLPDRPGLSEAAHLGSYALAAAFVAVNHRSVATLVIGVGGLLNLVAIAANGGVMPATRGALEASGWEPTPGHFANSGLVARPQVQFLGDVFATPSWLPVHSVFSVGDAGSTRDLAIVKAAGRPLGHGLGLQVVAKASRTTGLLDDGRQWLRPAAGGHPDPPPVPAAELLGMAPGAAGLARRTEGGAAARARTRRPARLRLIDPAGGRTVIILVACLALLAGYAVLPGSKLSRLARRRGGTPGWCGSPGGPGGGDLGLPDGRAGEAAHLGSTRSPRDSSPSTTARSRRW